MNNLLKRISLTFVSVVFALTGCQSTTGYYLGATAQQETIVSLSETTQESRQWQDLYVIVDYVVKEQGEKTLIEGSWIFADHPQGMMARVKDFKLKLFLLDQDNRVLDYFDLSRSVGGDLDVRMNFSKIFNLPQGAIAAAFGYEGSFLGEYDAGDTVWKLPLGEPVWRLPKKSP